MAIVKHIKSKNANYTDAINYLFYQHDEKTKTLLLNEYGQPMLREEFYADGLNCTPETFDLDCSGTNRTFNKNRRPGEIKSHHYIISYDPRDASDCGLTGEKAQELSLEVAQKMFPGHQALVVTHTDGENHSGNIHTHIMINSVTDGKENRNQADSSYAPQILRRIKTEFRLGAGTDTVSPRSQAS